MRYFLLLTISVLFINCCGKDDAAIREVNKLIDRQQYDAAHAIIEKSLQEKPNDPKFLRLQIRYLLATDQAVLSALVYQKLLEVSPRDTILLDAIGDKNTEVRLTAVRAFGEIKTPNTIVALTRAANDADKSVRQAVLHSAIKLGDREMLPVLNKLLRDPDWFVRGNAVLALGKIGDTNSVGELFSLITDSDPYVRKSTKLSLQRLATPENLPAYQAFLTSDVPANRALAALILASNNDPAAIPVLVAELDNPANPDLSEIIQVLAKTKAPDALPALRRLAADANSDVKINAILALGEYKDKASRELLQKIQKDPNATREVKTAVTVALEKLR